MRHRRSLQERQGGYPFSCLPELSQHAREPRVRQHGGFSHHHARKLTKVKKTTDEDDTLQHPKSVIMNGWPDKKQDLPAELIAYYSFRDEMSVQDRLIFKVEQVIVPFSMRPEMKTAIHSSHSGIDGCLKTASECLF